MNNKEILNSRKVLLNFFTINFDFIDKDTMISKMINFYLYPKINSLSKEKNIHIDYSGNEIQIEHNDILTTINLINHYADSETKINTINAKLHCIMIVVENTRFNRCGLFLPISKFKNLELAPDSAELMRLNIKTKPATTL